jgi:ubiquinone/menaquinone biosynthesis C-methylase UbiE
MKSVSHKTQQKLWDKEHKNPNELLQMNSEEASSGVIKFYEWITKKKDTKNLKGIELGCGKGRNVIYLARQGIETVGLDFSPFAIKEAKKRAKEIKNAKFLIHDATIPWPFKDNSFDFTIDCFATSDIESKMGRAFAVSEMIRILKPGGYMLVYNMSPEDEYQQQLITESPAEEKNAFIRKGGKFEKTFDKKELLELYQGLKLLVHERLRKLATFNGASYPCKHHWMIFQK